MSEFKPYQAIMVLNLNCDGTYYDVKGTYIKEMFIGYYKGKHKTEVNTCSVYVEIERLMDHDAYFNLWNSDKSKLPAEACGKLQFLAGDYKSEGDLK